MLGGSALTEDDEGDGSFCLGVVDKRVACRKGDTTLSVEDSELLELLELEEDEDDDDEWLTVDPEEAVWVGGWRCGRKKLCELTLDF